MIFLIIIKYKLATINNIDNFILRKNMDKKEILINMRNIFKEDYKRELSHGFVKV